MRGKGACGEKGHVNMETKCVWAYRAQCRCITKTRDDPAANPCKYLFRVVLGHLTAIWTLPKNADQRQRKQRALRRTRASHFPGPRVLLRIVCPSDRAAVPNSCSRAPVAPVQSFRSLGRFSKPTEPKRPPGQNGPDTQRAAV